MPVSLSYPGVYVEELGSGVHTITGVATSIAAFVDVFQTGPIDKAVRLLSYPDFERAFGGLSAKSEASYAIQQFFQNGGSQAYAIRITSTTSANAATAAAIGLSDTAGGSPALIATAKYKGEAGANIGLDVDYATSAPDKSFNLTVTQYALSHGSRVPVAREVYRNLVISSSDALDAAAVVSDQSDIITLAEASGSGGKRPLPTGTASAVIANIAAAGLAATDKLFVALNGGTAIQTAALGTVPSSLSALASALQSLIRAAKDAKGAALLPGAVVSVAGNSSGPASIVVQGGTGVAADIVALSGDIGTKLNFASNVSQYALGADAVAHSGQVLPGSARAPGSDGTIDFANDANGLTDGLIGDPDAKTGLYALKDVDIFNMLCIPATMNLPDDNAAQVASKATTFCVDRRAMYIVDVPQASSTRASVTSVSQWLDKYASLRSKNAVVYFPRVEAPDPLASYRQRKFAPSGVMAGIWARTDAGRGVWKAPAGTEASLSGVQQLEYRLSDAENGVLNPVAINCLRVFPVFGSVSWGARTLNGADQMTDDYKYLPVRRLALFIEESLFRGTQWVVFEPNDAPLWAQIRLNVGAFMQSLFLQGAFQGATPSAAYFVRCDATNNPPASVNLGIVNINIGFAPLKPAEFVVLQIQQISQLAAA
jgi:uncharacterized protein